MIKIDWNREKKKKQQRERRKCVVFESFFEMNIELNSQVLYRDYISVKCDRKPSVPICIMFKLLNFKYKESFL